MPFQTQKTMQAVAIDRFGGPEVLTRQTLPVPDIDSDEVLIRLEAIGVGVWDPWEREGAFHQLFRERYGVEPTFPYVIGFEGAGTVAAVGADVTRFREGDRVYADRHINPKGGFYAEYVAVVADHVVPIPDGLSVEEAGAMPVDAITALLGLDSVLGLCEGESVLIFGAGGGLGVISR
ncbi:quinone oxidoreductase family protein [Halomonas maura]|uniref:quinone oxidoreductase family protein n=1 Tax=Halomonas maura TaxID=117606 RepID=UPI0025B4EF95|nr:alcohol dehydrogenase catalytic domain-containing protein [Halomonas maura]